MAASEESGLLTAAAEGLLALYDVQPPPNGSETREWLIEGATLEDRLVAWLNELIYLIGTRRWVPRRVIIEPASMTASLEGSPLGASRLALEIKAATFGGLSVRKDETGALRTTVILDV